MVLASPFVLLALAVLGTQLMNDWRLKRWSELPFEPITALGVDYKILASGRSISPGTSSGHCLFSAYYLLSIESYTHEILKKLQKIEFPRIAGNKEWATYIVKFRYVEETSQIVIKVQDKTYGNYLDIRCIEQLK